MKRSNRLHDEELKFINSINKMSNQVQLNDQGINSFDSQSVIETIEDLLNKIKTIRTSRLKIMDSVSFKVS